MVALATTVAVTVGTLGLLGTPASAAPGDATSFPTGAGAFGIAQDAGGTLWVANPGASSISKVALDGTTVTYQTNATPQPLEITAGPGGFMWYVDQTSDKIGRISSDGSVQTFSAGTNNSARDIALGPDGNMWFTLPVARKVGKITPSGAVTTYDTGGIAMSFITPGPATSNRMYVGSRSDNKLGIVTMAGDFTAIDGPSNAQGVFDIQLINNQIWFVSVTGAIGTLTRLINDSGFTLVNNPNLANARLIGTGLDGTMWVSQANNAISHVTTSGDVVATYNASNLARDLLQAADGNLWATIGDGVTRILTGVVPTNSTAPAVTPTSGLAAGAVATTSNGQWAYLPTSYSYQWQVCTASDASTCTDAAGATGQTYTVAAADVGKYLRVGVRATNLNGQSQPAYSNLVATGQAPAPAPAPAPTPTGPTATIGNGVTMELDAPASQKRNASKFYEVVFSAPNVQGQVVFEFARGGKKQTKTVVVQQGVAEYRWKAPRNWRKGNATVTATFVPAAGSPYQSGKVTDRVRIR